VKPRRVIVHLIATNFVGGPEKQILQHGLRLSNGTDFDFCLISFIERGRLNELLERAGGQGLAARRLQTSNPFNPRVIIDLVRLLRSVDCSLLMTHGYKSNVVGWIASRKAGLPQVAVSRGWTAESWKIRAYEALDRMALRAMDQVVAVSEGQRQKLLAVGLDPERVRVIHNAINLHDVVQPSRKCLRAEFGLPDNALIVASAGRLSPEKNYSAMIEVARRICAHHEKACFIVFGEGFLRPELERKIAMAGLQGRFLLPGFRSDLPVLLPEVDIFMLPSLTEGLPNVVLEAFANRNPVVATAVGGTPEVVQHDVSGFLTTPDDVAGMVEALGKLIADSELRQRMGHAGYEYVAANFDFDSQTAAYERLYADVLQKSGAGR
jgi:glycosyltransferase involved in cell wall biosynthesis